MAFTFLDFSRFLAVFLLAFAGCSRPIKQPEPSDFRVGATRSEILKKFGTPLHEQSFYQNGTPVWGPIETFLSQVPLGSKVEIWSYAAQGGTIELYFVDGADRVQGIGFALEGAVYEGGT